MGDKVLVLQPSESKKLLMQWKKPLGVLKNVGGNDYDNAYWKEKTIHGNLLKRYIMRDAVNDETDDGPVSTTSLAVLEDDDENNSCDGCGCEVLPEIGCWRSKDTMDDLRFGDGLSTKQQRELEELKDSLLSPTTWFDNSEGDRVNVFNTCGTTPVSGTLCNETDVVRRDQEGKLLMFESW
ncbi:Zinc finger protein [Plakobranchus ocellatus]|uniref:Zinc finger protein n=1 Tax=Plakobranchus ocellatus TaxID=259542 RepID=A0AAV3YQV5_9GAST|nr:Zinc finger protein [Plakobranchus ocellatus]